METWTNDFQRVATLCESLPDEVQRMVQLLFQLTIKSPKNSNGTSEEKGQRVDCVAIGLRSVLTERNEEIYSWRAILLEFKERKEDLKEKDRDAFRGYLKTFGESRGFQWGPHETSDANDIGSLQIYLKGRYLISHDACSEIKEVEIFGPKKKSQDTIEANQIFPVVYSRNDWIKIGKTEEQYDNAILKLEQGLRNTSG